MEPVTQLFCQKSVLEMKELENKTRQEIELKKEELRQMVGERYRDLIEAADTISEMKRCSQSIKTSIQDLQQFCSNSTVIGRKKSSWSSQKQGTKEYKRYMEIAAETKILMEMPERIWSEVEAGNMINASFLYLQSLQVVNNLSLSGANSYSPILSWFPMLGQQAQAVGNLGSAILKQCHGRLNDHVIDCTKTAEALCSIVLLEKSRVGDVFQTLLKSRRAAIVDVLGSDVSGSGVSDHSVGAMARICESVNVLVQTLLQVSKLFCEKAGGLVADLLRQCGAQSVQDLIGNLLDKRELSTIWSKHLPAETTQNLVKLDSVQFEINSDILQQQCRAWLAEVTADMQLGIRKLLQFTTSAKDLAAIRTSLLDTLNVDDASSVAGTARSDSLMLSVDSEQPQAGQKTWQTSCRMVVGCEVRLWDESLKDLFVDKADQLIRSTFARLLEQSKEILKQARDQGRDQSDVSAFVWQEHDDDVTPTMAWNQWQNRKNRDLALAGGLALKARTVTPGVSKSCSNINAVVLDLLNDLEHYAPSIRTGTSEASSLKSTLSKNTFDHEDAVISERLRANCVEFLKDLMKHIASIESELQATASKQTQQSNLHQALHLSFVCRNFFTICSAFRLCCCPNDHQSSLRSSSIRAHYRDVKPGVQGDTENLTEATWRAIVADMAKHCQTFMSVWCDSVLNDALELYRHQLAISVSGGNLLHWMASWDTITVEEESESGKMVSSDIKVPASTTAFTLELLHALCSKITAIGGYAIGRNTFRSLSQNCLSGILGSFSKLRHSVSSADASLHGQSRTSTDASVPSQTWALQCLFDLRYVHTLLYQPPLIERGEEKDSDDEDDYDNDESDSPSYTFTELVDWLEGYVDPFDLDVFSPHLTRNIQRHIHRTSVMLGILAAPDRMGSTGASKFGMAKDSHNVLPLAVDCGRFSYLPVSGRSARSHQRLTSPLSRQLPMVHALRELTRSVNEDEDLKNAQETKLSSSLYSKLGALSSSWLSMSSSYTES